MTNYSAVRCPGCPNVIGLNETLDIPAEVEALGYKAVRDYVMNPKIDVQHKWIDCKRCSGKGFIAIDMDKLNKE